MEVGLDITERKRAEQALRLSNVYNRSLIEASLDPLVTIGPDGKITDVNAATEAATGYSRAELVGTDFCDYFTQPEKARAGYEQAFRAGAVRDHALDLRHRDGHVTSVLYHASVYRDEAGHVAGVFAAARDITERKRAETALRELNEQLEQRVAERTQALRIAKAEAERANAAKDQFIAKLSHELRTPLTPVVLTMSLLSNRPDLPQDVHDDLRTIQRNVMLEARLIDDLLDLTRIARGRMQFDFRVVDAHLIIRAAADICSQGDGATIELDLQAQHHWVRADPARLQQVFWNLLNNSRKFTPIDGRITIHSRDLADGRVQFEVVDTGTGIDAAVLPRLFDAFEQGVKNTGTMAGLGLGLTIAKAIVDAHGGTIGAASDGRDKGARFTIELTPVSEPMEDASDRAPSPAPTTPAAHRDRLLRILVVEDHEASRNTMCRLLATLGHEVQAADCVKSAKQLAHGQRFDLVVSDLGLPDGTGHDLMRWLKEQYGLCGIALSGYGMEEDIRLSREAGFAEHLTKPIDLDRFEAAINRVAK
jgi:two-component system CheB/CheR fusion protein